MIYPLYILPRKLPYVNFVVERPTCAKLSSPEWAIHWLLKAQEPLMQWSWRDPTGDGDIYDFGDFIAPFSGFSSR